MILILDFYVDEPACFGVPPYLSPYCRYTAGALVAGGISEDHIEYLTIDELRKQNFEISSDPEAIFLIAGATVPGRYLGGKIGSVADLLRFLELRDHENAPVIIGGPIRYSSPEIQKEIREKKGILIRGDIELYAEKLARHKAGFKTAVEELSNDGRYLYVKKRSYEDVDRYAERGAFLTNLHPDFPYLILELETYRGCTRNIFCSFCTEAFYGKPVFRSLEGILQEVAELYRMGNRHYRLGRQADLMTYLPDMNDFANSFPRPRPASLRSLYEGIHRVAPELQMLHLDNINPGLIATFPEESREIIKIISQYNTAGDTAAMGLESVDPAVIEANDLKCSEDEAMKAIEIVNEYGARRKDGIPALLPGLNFIHGLSGESEKTFEMNYRFLQKILDRGLLIRRINIRQVVAYRNTKIDRKGIKRSNILHNRFLYYRDKIRQEIDHKLLALNFPVSTILKNVIIESRNPGYFLGRPLGSYPVTVKIPLQDKAAEIASQTRKPLNVWITGAEERSLTAISHPLRINEAGISVLKSIPGIGKKTAGDIFLKRPLGESSLNDLFASTPLKPEDVISHPVDQQVVSKT